MGHNLMAELASHGLLLALKYLEMEDKTKQKKSDDSIPTF